MSKEMIVPIMKNNAASRFERLSIFSCIPAYPTTAPITGSAQQVLATALARPRINANVNVTGLVPTCPRVVLAHSESWNIPST
jgi:hypothetical protein